MHQGSALMLWCTAGGDCYCPQSTEEIGARCVKGRPR